MKDDDDYNVWRDTFGYHDEDFDGDVDWEDVDIADRHFKELQDVLYPKATFDDEDDDNDGDNDEDLFEDDDNDEDLFEDDDNDEYLLEDDDDNDDDDEWVNDDDDDDDNDDDNDDDEDVYHISIHFSLGASSRPDLTTVERPQPADTKVASDKNIASDTKVTDNANIATNTQVATNTAPTLTNTATVATTADESVSAVKPLGQVKAESNASSATTNQPENKAEADEDDKSVDLIAKLLLGILASFVVIGLIFVSIGCEPCETIGTVFLVIPEVIVAILYLFSKMLNNKTNKK
jgi:hypothetical protein